MIYRDDAGARLGRDKPEMVERPLGWLERFFVVHSSLYPPEAVHAALREAAFHERRASLLEGCQ